MSTAVEPKGKVALVTGSTSGIGLETARFLAKRGVNIIMTGSRDKSAVTDALDEIRRFGARADYISCDLSKSSNVKTLWAEVLKLYSDGIDILINNAGVGSLASVDTFPEEEYDRIVAINLTAPFLLTKSCVPGMKKKGWGRIINLSSIGGLISSAEYSVYTATKHGIIGFTKGVALDVATHGITCNAVSPAYTDTPMLQEAARNGAAKGLTQEQVMAYLISKQPVGSLIQTSQVAELIEFLCLSGASSQMTGAVYLIDGGYVAQ